jgi:hypothetical protein
VLHKVRPPWVREHFRRTRPETDEFFLRQDVHLGDAHGFEIIGRERKLMAEPSTDITSRYYGDDGSTFDYTYELDGDTLTIWAGERGSPAFYRGTFSPDDRTLTGAWVYPGGGGYESNSERVE